MSSTSFAKITDHLARYLSNSVPFFLNPDSVDP
jgi:hypothetical protein